VLSRGCHTRVLSGCCQGVVRVLLGCYAGGGGGCCTIQESPLIHRGYIWVLSGVCQRLVRVLSGCCQGVVCVVRGVWVPSKRDP